jgi:two-component system sensor histidine kinase KdpD
MEILAILKSSWIFSPRQRRGSSKFISAVPAGVGKTYRMLEEAHQLRAEGHDVVLGFIETHARAETAARVRDLERIPLKKVAYRGVTVEEMDVAGILARNPELAERL